MERARLKQVLDATGCAETHGGHVFLRDPKWGARERAQFEKLAAIAAAAKKRTAPETGWLCIPTGGTGGSLRFARHDERTLSAAARGFCAHYDLRRVNAVDVLPPFHVSGLMARVRCAATGGSHLPLAWEDLKARKFSRLPRRADGWVLSLVPTQLRQLLAAGGRALAWLRQFRIIFLGGAPVWDALAGAAANARLPVALSYGMTETAAMVAAQLPADFASGQRNSGRPMPHARIEIVDDMRIRNLTPFREKGSVFSCRGARVVAPGETGLVRVAGESVFRGYFGEEKNVPHTSRTSITSNTSPHVATRRHTSTDSHDAPAENFFQTEDLAFWDKHGGLNIVGRRDAVIISGGKKVFPTEVETLLRDSGVFADVAVVGAPDAKWGQCVVACYPGKSGARIDEARVERVLRPIAAYKRPKRYVRVPVADWPRNAQGKLNRAALARVAMTC